MTGYQKQGTCNRCGQCCGADGSPNQATPWPKTWLYCFKGYQQANKPPIVQLVGDRSEGGPIGYSVKLGNKTYRSVWVEGVGLCKDVAPWGDPSTYSLECPFLADDPGDGSRPCAFTGTAQESLRNTFECWPNGPEYFHNLESLQQWENDHPDCSHTWTEVVE